MDRIPTSLQGKHFIAGKLVDPISRKSFPLRSPATRETIADIALGDAADIDLAVRSAQHAFTSWKEVPARERGKLLLKCAELLQAHSRELAGIVSIETGKAIRTESLPEANNFSDSFRYYGGLASELKGETIPFNPNVLTVTLREPLGVVAAILAWNVPLMLFGQKVAPALAAGNTVVIKPAEEASLAVLRAAEILQEILPSGVINVVCGDGPDCGAPLVVHPLVKKVTFTGSVETGRRIYSLAAEKLIPVTLELGGKSPMIVMDDCDLEKAVEGAFIGMRFTRQGQSCTAASRIFVHEKIATAFVERLEARLSKLVIGNPLDEKTDVGTIISEPQYLRVNQYLELAAKTPGVKVISCAELPEEAPLKDGFFMRPALILNVPMDSPIIKEEIFGPVTAIIKFEAFEDAIRMANDSDYGLAATLWTNNLKLALRGSKLLEAGIVQINQNLVVQPSLAFGGFKNSGIGKEASLGAMLEHFTRLKTVAYNME